MKAGLISATLCGIFIAFISSVTAIFFQADDGQPGSLLLKLALAFVFYLVPIAFFVIGIDNLGFARNKTPVDQTGESIRAVSRRIMCCLCGAILFGLAYVSLVGEA